jgi:hypothetical protein
MRRTNERKSVIGYTKGYSLDWWMVGEHRPYAEV